MNRLNDLVEFWAAWLLHSGWQAAVVVGAVAVLMLLTRRRSAQFRYALLVIALVKFAAPPFLTLPVGVFSQSRLPVAPEFAMEVAAPNEVRNTDEASVGLPPARETSGSAPTNPQPTTYVTPDAAQNGALRAEKAVAIPKFHWGLFGLLLIHATGVCVAGFFFRRQYQEVRNLVRYSTFAAEEIVQLTRTTALQLGIKTIPAVMISEESDAPFATGLLQQIILLPRSALELPTDQLQIILGHELVHIRRRDLTIGWLETVLSILWWFHPGMWWLKRELRRTREDCCDDVLLASRLAVPARYCETLIEAAARQTFLAPEPVALGFSNGEHPAARRIRRLMDGSLFRTQRLQKTALLLAVVVGLLVLPGIRPAKAPVTKTSLEGLFGWRNLPFDPDQEELDIVKECEEVVNKFGSYYGRNGRQMTHFDDPETRDALDDILKRKPGFFYSQHLLGTWYRRNGDLVKGQELLSAALKNAPIVLTQRYRTGNGELLTNVNIERMSIECNRVKNHYLNPELKLAFVDLVTDSQGEVAVPVYDTVFRLASRSYPVGYDTEMSRLGWFSSESRIGVLPEITAWKRYARPNDFIRTASESALLSEAKGTTTGEISLGPNQYRIGRVARCQANGQFTEHNVSNSSELSKLPRMTNAGYMDHVIIDLTSPLPDRFEIGRVTVLDSKTKIPLTSFQPAAGVKVVDKTRFHLYSLAVKLPEEVDLVLTVHNHPAGSLRMIIPVAAKGDYTQDGVRFIVDYLGAGEHDGWSSKDGFYKDAKNLNFLSEMLYRIVPHDRQCALWLVAKDGQRIDLRASSPHVRISKPLAEIDHFELVPWVPEETIYFEKIALPPRTAPVNVELPTAEFRLTGIPETVSKELFSPIVLRCRTLHGYAFDHGSFSHPFGYGFDEQAGGQHDSESKCTVVIEAFAPSGITLSVQCLSHAKNVELPSTGGSSMSGEWGTVVSRKLSVPLKELGSVTVRLIPELPKK
ncbi:MAG: hypothetical protein JWN70_3763 [Planctomycetaceae bacterium]|nr:hypothetical protein [Planctomycetaceae bacterium]